MLEESSKISDSKSKELMKSVKDLEQREKDLKTQLESASAKEQGTATKATDLDH